MYKKKKPWIFKSKEGLSHIEIARAKSKARRVSIRLMPEPDNCLLGRRYIDPHSDCTPARRRLLRFALKRGLTVNTALQICGIRKIVYNQWIRKGRNNVGPVYREFYLDVAYILSERERESIASIRRAINGGEKIRETKIVLGKDGTEITRVIKTRASDWKAAAWHLEKLDPKTYGNMQRREDEQNLSPQEVASKISTALMMMERTIQGEEIGEQQQHNSSREMDALEVS